jgi:hypothetical protein
LMLQRLPLLLPRLLLLLLHLLLRRLRPLQSEPAILKEQTRGPQETENKQKLQQTPSYFSLLNLL